MGKATDDTIVNDEYASVLLEEMNQELERRLLPLTVFVGMEAVIGFIGNTLVIYLFVCHYKPCNYRAFSTFLSLIDLLCTFTTMSGEIMTQSFWYTYPAMEICKTKDFFNIFTVSAETLCLLVISIDRYRKICRPLKWQIGPNAAIVLCFIIVFVAGAISSPIVIFWGVRTYTKVYKNTTVLVTSCEKDETYEDTTYPSDYVLAIGGIIVVFLVTMFILNVVVAKVLISEGRRRRLGLKTRPPPQDTCVTVSIVDVPSEYNKTSVVVIEDEGTLFDSANVANGSSGASTTNPNETDVPNKNAEHDGNAKAVAADTIPKVNCVNMTKDVKDVPSKQRVVNVKQEKKLSSSEINAQRVRRKALIMFILTTTFCCTTVMYITMVTILGSDGNIVNGLSDLGKTLFFFFLRFYFIQHIINPILYVMLDPQIKAGMQSLFNTKLCRNKRSRVGVSG